ncbi:MAG: ATP-binding protein [Candidatus Omnitrophota bacterium]
MKIAFQTILCGPQIKNCSNLFLELRELGYDGVEIAQTPSMLPNVKDLKSLLEDTNLKFVGFAGGKLWKRFDYCEEFKPFYLYIENWHEKSCKEAISRGFKLALHPHAYKKIHNYELSKKILEDHPEIFFLPDTAHLYFAKDNPAIIIKRESNRIAAIHLKDWSPIYGRSFHRYARGFIELEKGEVFADSSNLSEFIKVITNIDEERNLNGEKYSNELFFKDLWLVIEQDYTPSDPIDCARYSIDWLNEKGISVDKKYPLRYPSHINLKTSKQICTYEKKAEYYNALVNITKMKDIKSFCDFILSSLQKIIPCKCISIWEHSPTNMLTIYPNNKPTTGSLRLLSFWPNEKIQYNNPYLRSCDSCLFGEAIDSQEVEIFDLTNICHDKPHLKFRMNEPDALIKEFSLKKMVSIPILNTYNPNQFVLVINLFPEDNIDLDNTQREWMEIGNSIAIAFETILEDICQSTASTINNLLVKEKTLKDFLGRAKDNIQLEMKCEGITIFLVNEYKDKLEPHESTGIQWEENLEIDKRYYNYGEGKTGNIWKNGMTLLTDDPRKLEGNKGKSWEIVKSSDKFSTLFFPLKDCMNDVIGVIRCRNRNIESTSYCLPNMFSESDVSILDAICQMVSPHLSIRLAEERKAKTLSRISHELKNPITAILGAISAIDRETKINKYRFRYPYIDEIKSYCELAKRIISKADFYRFQQKEFILNIKCIYLLKDIFEPVRTQIEILLLDRNFSSRNIKHDSFQEIQQLYVDHNYFQSVFFNLLTNSIKFAFDDPEKFKVNVKTKGEKRGYKIIFEDNGVGIPEGCEKKIFMEGYRGPNVDEFNVSGDGIGLWIVKEILEAHNCTIQVTKNKNPTTFEIFIPRELETSPKWYNPPKRMEE